MRLMSIRNLVFLPGRRLAGRRRADRVRAVAVGVAEPLSHLLVNNFYAFGRPCLPINLCLGGHFNLHEVTGEPRY